jgi:hypothetical protein
VFRIPSRFYSILSSMSVQYAVMMCLRVHDWFFLARCVRSGESSCSRVVFIWSIRDAGFVDL